jgi:predicted transcriptional regulator
MGLTKSSLFTAEQNEMARVAKAFAHPARIAIIHYLLNANACVNGDLVQELGLAQPTVSQHLRELKEVGLIQGSIEGPRVSYCINPDKWLEVKSMFNQIFDQYEKSGEENCCQREIE